MITLLLVSLVGLAAQLVDGAIGMAFGITSTTLLLIVGYGPAMASAIVHLSEIGTSIASGTFHWRYGNVDRVALVKVAVPGAIGAFVGAVILSTIDLSAAKPWTATLLLALGIIILVRFTQVRVLGRERRARARWLIPLGLTGGFVDATGGGGWGPIVTTTLTASNALPPRKAIGTTNTAEVLVSIAASAGFLLGLGTAKLPWDAVLALLIGGLIAAPIAAKLVSIAPQRILGLLTGLVVILLNVNQLARSLALTPEATAILLVLAAAASSVAIVIGVRVHLAERRALASESEPASGDPVEDLRD